MTKIYLCGPICGLTREQAQSWRRDVCGRFSPGIIGIDPLRGKNILLGDDPIGNHTSKLATHAMLTPRGITTRDRHDVMTCDALLVNLLDVERQTVSCGSMIEFGWADAWRKPTIVVAERENYAADHPMVSDLTSYRVETLSEAAAIINHMFNHSR